jgi:integrase
MAGKQGRKGNGEGNIRQRSDGRWEGRLILPDGCGKSFYGRTRADVARRLAAAIRDRDHGVLVALDERQTVGQYLETWIDVAKSQIRPSSWRRYNDYVRVHLVPGLGRSPLAKLTAQHVQLFYACPTLLCA